MEAVALDKSMYQVGNSRLFLHKGACAPALSPAASAVPSWLQHSLWAWRWQLCWEVIARA
jgi:hypothetical protein